MHWSEVWDGRGVGPAAIRTLLTPLSWVYCAGWQAYLATYKLGLNKPAEPHVPVLCIGNLVVGGSGKSPLTLFVSQQLQALGKQVVLSCSGYGSPAAEAARLAPEGDFDPAEWGDEPAMFRWLAPELPIVVGRRRVLAAQIVHKEFPNAVMLMDDGFQHLPLKKHLTIVIDRVGRNSRCLPAGPYREPWRNAKRADLVLPNETFKLVSYTEPVGAKGSRIQVLCALGTPLGFLQTLGEQGLVIRGVKILPDHDPLTAGNLFDSFDLELPIAVTGKDWVKLRRRADFGKWDIRVVKHEVRVEPEAEFQAWLAARLDAF